MKRLLNYLTFIVKTFNKVERDSFFVQDFNGISHKEYIKENYILNLCKNKKILHFGFLDYPITVEKVSNNTFLHTKLKLVCDVLFGVDIFDDNIKQYSAITGDNNVILCNIVTDDIDSFDLFNSRFDYVLLPDVLEHVVNPGIMIERLHKLCTKTGAKLLVTVPNAFNAYAFAECLNGKENVHPDHYFYFSPYTLRKILLDYNFQIEDLSFYISPNLKNMPGISKYGIMAIANIESLEI
jgi:hypothetical protein